MRKYYIILILISLFYVNNLYSQPPFDDDDRDMDGIEDIDGVPPCPPDFEEHPMMHGKMQRMSEERIEKVMNIIMEKHPEFYKKLTGLKEEHPKVFMRTMHKLRKFMRNSKKGTEDKTALIGIFNDEIEMDILIEQYFSEKDSGKKDKVKAEILKKMSLLFDKKEKMKLELILNIEKNLEKKKADFEKRKLDKNEILKKDLEKMLKFHERMEQDDE